MGPQGNLSRYEPGDGHTYILNIEEQKTTDLLGSLSKCYRAHEKESRITDRLAQAISVYLVDQDDNVLIDALRAYREHRSLDD